MSAKAPLRLGIMIDSFRQPQWIHKIISDIQASSIAQIVLVIKNEASSESQAHSRKFPIVQKLSNNKNDLLYILYRKLDTKLFKAFPDAFHNVSIEKLVTNCLSLHVTPIRKKYSDYFPADDIATIMEYKLDVVLRFGFRILRGRILQVANYGVWSYHHGDNFVNRGGPPGFWEVMEGHPVTGSILQILSEELDAGKVIYRSYAATHKYSVNRNRNNYYWKSSAFVMRKLQDLYTHGPSALCDDGRCTVSRPYYHRLYKQPGNVDLLKLVLKLSANYFLIKLEGLFYVHQWFLAYCMSQSPTIEHTFYRFKSIIPPKDRFWADPFVVREEDRFFIFIEEFIFHRKKGRIAVIEMDQQGNWQPPVPVLETNYHLSYPFVFKWQNNYYMIPETASTKTIELYRCTSFPFTWSLEKVLMSNISAADTTLAHIEDRWWMFVNMAAVEGASKDDELHIFYADSPLGPWLSHKRNPVKSDVRSSRPAGQLFQCHGRWYRPAQDCSETYGYAITLNRLEHLDADTFEEREISKILPHWQKNLVATHTLNHAPHLTVVDAQVKRRKFF
jgi:hypothetical protein